MACSLHVLFLRPLLYRVGSSCRHRASALLWHRPVAGAALLRAETVPPIVHGVPPLVFPVFRRAVLVVKTPSVRRGMSCTYPLRAPSFLTVQLSSPIPTPGRTVHHHLPSLVVTCLRDTTPWNGLRRTRNSRGRSGAISSHGVHSSRARSIVDVVHLDYVFAGAAAAEGSPGWWTRKCLQQMRPGMVAVGSQE